MTPEERTALEGRAERALRRGELAEAIQDFQALVAAFPLDASLSRKLEEIRALQDPAELAASRPVGRPPLAPMASPEQEAEGLFASGDYAGAAAAYRRALALRPDNELVRERLQESYQLARAHAAPGQRKPPPDREALLRNLLDRLGSRRRSE